MNTNIRLDGCYLFCSSFRQLANYLHTYHPQLVAAPYRKKTPTVKGRPIQSWLRRGGLSQSPIAYSPTTLFGNYCNQECLPVGHPVAVTNRPRLQAATGNVGISSTSALLAAVQCLDSSESDWGCEFCVGHFFIGHNLL